MSTTPTSHDPAQPKLLHIWEVSIDRDVQETADEVVNGQTVKVTRTVKRPVTTRMALRALKRPEARAADLFQASRTAHYVKDHGLLLASELTNRLINTTGGVLTDKEKSRIEQLKERHVQLDMDLARGVNSLAPDEKVRIQRELAAVRGELINLNAINEQVYAQTAEAKAQADLNSWLTFTLVLIDRGTPGAPRWVPYFEGTGKTAQEEFEAREAFMWSLEESGDEFYKAALPKISVYTYWFAKGADTPEAFRLMDEELARQSEARKAEEAGAGAVAAIPTEAASEPATPAPTVS